VYLTLMFDTAVGSLPASAPVCSCVAPSWRPTAVWPTSGGWIAVRYREFVAWMSKTQSYDLPWPNASLKREVEIPEAFDSVVALVAPSDAVIATSAIGNSFRVSSLRTITAPLILVVPGLQRCVRTASKIATALATTATIVQTSTSLRFTSVPQMPLPTNQFDAPFAQIAVRRSLLSISPCIQVISIWSLFQPESECTPKMSMRGRRMQAGRSMGSFECAK